MSMETVAAWHTALNAKDVDGVVALCTDDVEIAGPRGAAHGHDVLRKWVESAGITLEPLRAWPRGDAVVVEQEARWDADPAVHEVFTVFTLRGRRIAAIARFDDMEEALEAAG